jgi:CDP-diacylglycerol--glycerol-3-phosphate 3-phosphatidyltransferase
MDVVRQNIPNALSVMRIIMILPFSYALIYDDMTGVILIMVAILLSDYFDGYLARKWGATSDLGMILDPLADKACVATVGIILVFLRGFPLSLAIAMILRDILIVVAGLMLIRKDTMIPVSNNLGRVTVSSFAACMIVYLFQWNALKAPAVILAVVMLVASSISYARIFYRRVLSTNV